MHKKLTVKKVDPSYHRNLYPVLSSTKIRLHFFILSDLDLYRRQMISQIVSGSLILCHSITTYDAPDENLSL